MTPQEFAKTIKTKYPQYKDIDDLELAKTVVAKYPTYKDTVQFTETETPAVPTTKVPLSVFGANRGASTAKTAPTMGIQASTVVQEPEKLGLVEGVKQDFLERDQQMTDFNESDANPVRKVLNIFGTGARFLGDVTKRVLGSTPDLIKQPFMKGFEDSTKMLLENPVGRMGIKALEAGEDAFSDFEQAHPDAAKTIRDLASIGGVLSTAVGGGPVLKTAAKEAQYGLKVAKEALDTGTGAIKKTVTEAVDKSIKPVSTILERIASPDIPEVAKTSLNPVKAFKDTGQDMRVTVGGKSKLVSELNPTEKTKLKVSTEKSYDTFSKQAEKFKINRDAGSPVETVGNRTDSALQFADKKRQIVGQKMGEIEQKLAGDVLEAKDATKKAFTDLEVLANNPTYGKSLQDSPVVKKLIEDFQTLNENGLTVAERTKFARAWDAEIRDAKDAFGNFKENGTVYTKIQNAVNTLKNETVDYVSSKNKVYRDLRKQYAEHVKLQEIGDMLLGKDGALGDRIKGAATVKRAIQSNSDAGARQFLKKLKEISGYDAIREGDLALTAMEAIGDYHGLSLLDVIRKGRAGILEAVIGGTLDKAQDLIVGGQQKRIKRLIKK